MELECFSDGTLPEEEAANTGKVGRKEGRKEGRKGCEERNMKEGGSQHREGRKEGKGRKEGRGVKKGI